MLTTVPVSSVSLTGLPSPNCTHLWRELLPSPWWRGVDLAGLLGMTTMPPLTEPTVELESGRTSSRSSGTMLWRPTIGLDEDGAVLAGPGRPWTPACREVCADLWQLCSDWPSSADELTGPLHSFSAGAPMWNVECWTASQWTGILDLVWGRTSRSWWSSRETGWPWWLSGRAVELLPVYLPWSASHLSRRVASHLAASTARQRVSAAWWTPVEKSPVQTEDKWTGTPCWPRNADTCGQPDASAHEDRHRVCLSTPSTPDFWWLIGRTLASPSWGVELPCGGWEWTGRSQVVDLLSSWEPETTDCRNPGTSRWWLALWLLHQQGIDSLLKVLLAVPGPETDALMGELRSLLECNAHTVPDDAGGPAVAQQTPPVQGKVCQVSPHLGPVNVVWLRKMKKSCQTSCFLGRVVDGPFQRQLERATPVWQSSALWMEGSPAGQTLKV